MDLLQAIILSIVEGVSEFLPISSTGHLVLVSDLLNIPQTEFVKSFEIIIQLGAILAVVFLYWKTLLSQKELWLKIVVAFIPSAILGLIFYDFIKSVLIGNSMVTVIALALGGIFLIGFEKYYDKEKSHMAELKDLSLKQAFIVGLCQSVSMIPGVSRAAATIIGGLLVGFNRQKAVEFSFLLAIPTMAAATGLDVLKTGLNFSSYELMLLGVGFIASFITALVSIKFFLSFIKTNTFVPFGIYRIILALVFWIFILK